LATPFTQTLTSARMNVDVETFEATAAQVTPRCAVPWSVRKTRLKGGRQQGVDLVEIDNGRMKIRVLPTRGMGIADVTMGDLRLGWDSPVREFVHPSTVNLEARGATAWLEGFNEWLVRCGLEWFGPPGEEPFHLAKAEPPVGRLSLHGKIANIPASELELQVETKAPYRIRLIGTVHERMMYGPKLELRSEIVVEPGAASFEIDDTVTNRAGQAHEWALLYHLNFGRPILEEGARWAAPIAWLAPRDAESAKHIKRVDRYSAPRPGSLEQAFLAELHADRRGRTAAMVYNKAKSLGATVAWPKKALPRFTVWKAEHHEADGYVTGLEPGTSHPLPRAVERAAKRLPRLRAGQGQRHTLEVSLHDGRSEVSAALKRIQAIGRGRAAKIDPTPYLD